MEQLVFVEYIRAFLDENVSIDRIHGRFKPQMKLSTMDHVVNVFEDVDRNVSIL